MYAHFWRKGKAGILEITKDRAGRELVKIINVQGKKEAKAVAIAEKATPYNF